MIERLKKYLVDKYAVCVLSDLDGKNRVNIVNGVRTELSVKSYAVPYQYGDENDSDYTVRVAKDLILENPGMSHFTFFEFRDDLDSGLRLRYAAVPYTPPKNPWEM